VWLAAIVFSLLSFVVAITFLGIELEDGLKKQVVRPARGCWGSDFPEGAQL
jgi:hypothetical protein